MNAATRNIFTSGRSLELMGRADVAKALGTSSPNLSNIKDLPEPVCRISSGPVWLASDIRAFAKVRA